jgi:hypothetical protein
VTTGGGTAPPGGPRRGLGPPDPGPEGTRSEQPISLEDIWRSEALVDALAARSRLPAADRRDPVAELLAAFTGDVDQPGGPPLANAAPGTIVTLPAAGRPRQARPGRRPGRVPVRALATGLAVAMAVTGLAVIARPSRAAGTALSAPLQPAVQRAAPSGPAAVRGVPTASQPGTGPSTAAGDKQPGTIPAAPAAVSRSHGAGAPGQAPGRPGGTQTGHAASSGGWGGARAAGSGQAPRSAGPMAASPGPGTRPAAPATHPVARLGHPSAGQHAAAGRHGFAAPRAARPQLTPGGPAQSRTARDRRGQARPGSASPVISQPSAATPGAAGHRARVPGQPWQFWLRGSRKAPQPQDRAPGGTRQRALARPGE